MNLEQKVKKLKLQPLTDELRYEMAIDKSRVYLYEKFDYFYTGKRGGHYFYSKDYLDKHSYRQLVKEHRVASGKNIWFRLDVLMLKLDRLMYRLMR